MCYKYGLPVGWLPKMNRKYVKTKVAASCSRSSNGCINVRFVDEESRSGLEVEFLPSDFANWVTGLLTADIPARFWDSDKIGSTRVSKTVSCSFDRLKHGHCKTEAARVANEWVSMNMPDWYLDDSFNSQSSFSQDRINFLVTKFEPMEDSHGD